MLPNIFCSRTDYISGAYATKMVAISSPESNAVKLEINVIVLIPLKLSKTQPVVSKVNLSEQICFITLDLKMTAD